MKKRKHERAKGMTSATYSMPKALKNQIEQMACDDGSTASAWLRRVLMKIINRSNAHRRAAKLNGGAA